MYWLAFTMSCADAPSFKPGTGSFKKASFSSGDNVDCAMNPDRFGAELDVRLSVRFERNVNRLRVGLDGAGLDGAGLDGIGLGEPYAMVFLAKYRISLAVNGRLSLMAVRTVLTSSAVSLFLPQRMRKARRTTTSNSWLTNKANHFILNVL